MDLHETLANAIAEHLGEELQGPKSDQEIAHVMAELVAVNVATLASAICIMVQLKDKLAQETKGECIDKDSMALVILGGATMALHEQVEQNVDNHELTDHINFGADVSVIDVASIIEGLRK